VGIARVHCSKEFLADVLKGPPGFKSDAPKDLEVVEVRESKYHPRTVTFVIQSEAFADELLELQPPPLVMFTYEHEE